jgi:16S rRNA C967 or C1407 C5-methylase (RsmB/RsmF family)
MSLPAALLAMITEVAGERAGEVLAGLDEPRLPSFRANTLKGPVGALRRDLTTAGVPFTPHPLSDWSFTTTVEGEQALRASDPYRDGRLYSQGIASQLPALVGPVRAGMRVLDTCAAPGGKATLLAMRLGDEGRGLTACERAPVRMEKLRHTLELLGAKRVRAVLADSREPPEGIAKARWDHILIDAPCTGSGSVRPADPHTFRILAEDYDAYAVSRSAIQRALVERAAAQLAPGGTLVYSTCSVDPRENESVVEHLMHVRAPLEPLDLSSWGRHFPGRSSPGVNGFRGRTFGAWTSGCLRLWPCAAHEGFFVSLFKKKR